MRQWIDLINESYIHTQFHSAPQGLRERPGFEEWFAGSKAIDENGEPLMVFHGSFEHFAEFKLESENRRAYGFNRLGYWFDVDPRTPEYYGGFGTRDRPSEKSSGGVMPCVLSIKKPFYLDSEYLWSPEIEALSEIKAEYEAQCEQYYKTKTDDLGNYRLPDNTFFNYQEYKKLEKEYDRLRQAIIASGFEDGRADRIDAFDTLMKCLPKGPKSSEAEVEEFRNQLIAEGHDGIYLGDTAADFGTRGLAPTGWFIAFHPHQIKSILAQSFSANSNNIMEGVDDA